MIWLAGLAVFCSAACVIACVHVIDHNLRSHARERALLVNQLMHVAGRTWTPPPAEEWRPPENGYDPDRYLASDSAETEQF